jgi:phospholipid/cholesterol/gamma-HCH transport system substrate-binding protein
MQSSIVETIIGAAVLAVAALFVVFVYSSANSAGSDGYEVLAKFNRVDGVTVGSDVRMSGIKIGTVSDLKLDPKSFMAVAHLSIATDVKLPSDSSIRITSQGLLGGQYLSIEPGSDTANIQPGGEIEHTQGSIDLIGLLGKTMFQGGASQ